jgi:hypothetical protein
MKRKSILNLLLLFVIISFSSGCAINRETAKIDPATDLSVIKSIYVKRFEPDKRELNKLIAEEIKKRGFVVDTGDNVPSDVDIVVTYVDKWMWDMTNYMIELTIVFRDPETDLPLATGNSYHTSLSRRSPEKMVEEVINNIFNEAGKQ